MQTVLMDTNPQAFPSARGLPLPHPQSAATLPEMDASIEDSPTSRGFTALLAAYRSSGGTARGDDVARLLEDHGLGDFIGLARLIAGSNVFGFEWRSTLWIPMFQFDLRDLSVKSSAQLVLGELGAGFNGWARAAWFARPNNWLLRRKPVDLMGSNLEDVLSAARADRFVAGC